MTFPPSLHPNSFSFPSFDLNICFLQCKQRSSLFLSVESEISKCLQGLKFVNVLGAAPLDPPWELTAHPPPPPPKSLTKAPKDQSPQDKSPQTKLRKTKSPKDKCPQDKFF